MKPNSRLCVKNLPKHLSEARLRKVFEAKGSVTDVKLLKNRDTGESRRVAFIGYSSLAEATAARSYFHKSFIDTSRVQVDYARPIESSEVFQQRKQEEQQDKQDKVDKALNEFLAVNQRKKQPFWANDAHFEEQDVDQKEHVQFDEEDSDDEDEEEPALVLPKDEEEEESPDNIDISRLFVRNLPYAVSEDDLYELFSPFGSIESLHVPVDDIQRCKGFAFVQYEEAVAAVAALAKLDQSVFQGRLLHVLPAREKPRAAQEGDELDPESFLAKKESKLDARKKDSSIWNTLFVGAHAAVSAVAEASGVSKARILTEEAGGVSAAVKVALAETHVISHTKAFLEEHGVAVNSLHQAKDCKRSTTVIMAKNLPADTKDTDMRRVFGKFGFVGRVVVSPGGVLALVEFLKASEAAAGFSAMAYKRFKASPLYLEWAPDSVFSRAYDEAKDGKSTTVAQELVSEEDAPALGSTLCVKNLSFDTTERTLQRTFSGVGGTRQVTIARHRKHGKLLSTGFGFIEYESPDSAMTALKKLQGVQVDGHHLELSVARSKTEAPARVSKRALHDGPKSTKLIVKNLPFETNKKELLELFSTFADVKSVRIPTKFGGGHRGFGFIEFLSEHDAERALAKLENTHFYGRRLVLEWPSNEEDRLQAEDNKRARHD